MECLSLLEPQNAEWLLTRRFWAGAGRAWLFRWYRDTAFGVSKE